MVDQVQLLETKKALRFSGVANTDPVPDKAETLNVTLNPSARRVIEQLRADTGIPKTEAMTRILEWFASLDRKFRVAILHRDTEATREFSRLALTEMAGLDKVGLNKPPETIGPEDAAAAIHTLVDQLLAISRKRGQALYDVAVKPKGAAEKGQGAKGK